MYREIIELKKDISNKTLSKIKIMLFHGCGKMKTQMKAVI